MYQVFDAAANRWRAYAYVATEAANSGVQTLDLSGLPLTAGLATTNLDTSSQHTLYVSNIDYATNAALPGLQPVLYVAGSNLSGGSWRAYSLANPASPQLFEQRTLDALHARFDEPGRHRRTRGPVRAAARPVRGARRLQRRPGRALGRHQQGGAGAARRGDESEQPLHPLGLAVGGRHAPHLSRRARGDSARPRDADLHAESRELARADGRAEPRRCDVDDRPQRLHARHLLLRLALPARRGRLRRGRPEPARRGRAFRQLRHAEQQRRGHRRDLGRLSVPAVRQSARQRHRERAVRAARSHADAEPERGSGRFRRARGGRHRRCAERRARPRAARRRSRRQRQRAIQRDGGLRHRRRRLRRERRARCRGAPATTATRTSSSRCPTTRPTREPRRSR